MATGPQKCVDKKYSLFVCGLVITLSAADLICWIGMLPLAKFADNKPGALLHTELNNLFNIAEIIMNVVLFQKSCMKINKGIIIIYYILYKT